MNVNQSDCRAGRYTGNKMFTPAPLAKPAQLAFSVEPRHAVYGALNQVI